MINNIELAKECGAWIPDRDEECVTLEGDAVFRPDQLQAYYNAILDEVEKDLRSKFVGIADIVDAIRAMKVEV